MDNVEAALKRLRDNHELADFTLVAENGKEWRVHKLVLFMHSNVLYRMSTSQNYAEGQIGCVTLKEVCADSIKAMVRYLYDPQDFRPYHTGSPKDYDSIKQHMHMLIGMWKLGDMYNMGRMKELARTVYLEFRGCRNFVEHMELAIDALSELDGPTEFWDTIRYSLKHLFESRHPYEPKDVAKMFKEYPDLAMGVLEDLVNVHYRTNCPNP
ncbi:hypothetical protein M409DRAFT_25467 [Zasmidium cellare ATCC 36951]|uniref:BTB domain-containing protein n=1 Tax=Zasmidium cellare ATCC 36951 TaxID=1080233 RepID=A0A6A6CAN6_ZASCE|nr:uncharacterized protein M409DRAFT_25467 [Zasmidium cellare ATCC 36951]KAF2164121.1 hypothetical protein M409DRAFT_25467 [Zasmidium cellare ATCC 36951]